MNIHRHPPEPVDSGWMTDNCGNVVAWMRPNNLDDLIEELEAGGTAFAIAFLKEIQSEIKKLPTLWAPYANPESEPVDEETC